MTHVQNKALPILPTPGLTAPRFSRLRFMAAGAEGEGTPGGEGGDGFKPITSQDELNRTIGDRIARAERKAVEKYADYDALKAKAQQFDTAQQASKTEAEKTADRIATLEKELTGTKSAALRTSIAAEYGVSTKKGPNGEPSDAELFLTATDEATLRAQAERLAESATDRKKTGGRDPYAGRTPSKSGTDPVREFTRDLFGGGD